MASCPIHLFLSPTHPPPAQNVPSMIILSTLQSFTCLHSLSLPSLPTPKWSISSIVDRPSFCQLTSIDPDALIFPCPPSLAASPSHPAQPAPQDHHAHPLR